MAGSEDRPGLSHINASGDAHMVDVTKKASTMRVAEAKGIVTMRPETLALIRNDTAAKGDVLGVARVAGIMAAKITSDLIPLCHGISLTGTEVRFEMLTDASGVAIIAQTKTEGKTGVEMEALTAVSIAALTIYDMCKAVDRSMRIENIRLTYKTGGKSGTFRAE